MIVNERSLQVANDVQNVDVFNEAGHALLSGSLGPILRGSTADFAVYRIHSKILNRRVLAFVDRRYFKLVSVEW